MKRKLHILLPILIVCSLAPMASAIAIGGPKYDDFMVTLEGYNQLVDGGGTGWWNPDTNSPWIYYDTTDWWNQWFYDDPPSWERMKRIQYTFEVVPAVIDPILTDTQISVEVALNWSNMDYPATGEFGDPPMPWQEEFIERETIFAKDFLELGQPYFVDGIYEIWDYNPEWVSIDIRIYALGYNTWTDPTNGMTFTEEVLIPVDVFGEIVHECIIPEPTSLALLGFGMISLLRKK